MNVFRQVMSVAVTLLFISDTHAGQVDAGQVLNDRLTTKALVTYIRQVPVTTQVCRQVTRRARCGGGGHAPAEGCADNIYEATVCTAEPVMQTIHSDAAALTATTSVVAITDMKFDESKIVTLPERGLLAMVEYQNCDDVSLSQTLNLSVTGTRGYAITHSESVTTSKSAEVTLSGNWKVGSASTRLAITKSVSIGTSETVSSSEAITRSSSTTVSIPPRQSGRLELLAYENTIEIPYSATVEVDADLVANASNIVLASQLLNKSERSFPVRGILRLTEVSNTKLRTVKADKPDQCAAGDKALRMVSQPFSVLTAKTLETPLRDDFSRLALKSKGLKQTSRSVPVAAFAGEPQIGPADGVGYEIVSTAITANATVACGFNDLGLMNLGRFSVETRRYTSYSNGSVVSSWTERVETFMGCF